MRLCLVYGFFFTLIGPSCLLYTYSLLFIYQGIDASSITFRSLGQIVFLMFPKKKKKNTIAIN